MTNFKVGDRVRVVRKIQSYTNGWDNSWISDMDDAVGKTGTITSVSTNQSTIDFDEKFTRIEFEYPHIALEHVTEEKVPQVSVPEVSVPESPVPKFKVGDKVKITRTASTGEFGHCFWDEEYSTEVGKVGEIDSVDIDEAGDGEPAGVSYYVSGAGWHVPEQCLELVNENGSSIDTETVDLDELAATAHSQETPKVGMDVIRRLTYAIGVVEYLEDGGLELTAETAKGLLLYVVGAKQLTINAEIE